MKLKPNFTRAAVALALSLALAACDGDDGATGPAGASGAAGADGTNGLVSLTKHTELFGGNKACFYGGTRIESGLDTDADGELADSEISDTSYVCAVEPNLQQRHFNRLATFAVCEQINATCDIPGDSETSAEIVAASTDGLTLIYTDSPLNQIGFVDINDPANPAADGVLAMPGEPTSVACKIRLCFGWYQSIYRLY